jgi:hypothetical protein
MALLLQENGDKILLEDLTGFVILEAGGVPPPTVFYQAGGAGYPVKNRRSRRNDTQALFARLERTLQIAVGLVVPDVGDAPRPTETPSPPRPSELASEAIEESLGRLAALAEGRRSLELRLERLRESLRALAEEDRRRQDDDEFWLLLM